MPLSDQTRLYDRWLALQGDSRALVGATRSGKDRGIVRLDVDGSIMWSIEYPCRQRAPLYVHDPLRVANGMVSSTNGRSIRFWDLDGCPGERLDLPVLPGEGADFVLHHPEGWFAATRKGASRVRVLRVDHHGREIWATDLAVPVDASTRFRSWAPGGQGLLPFGDLLMAYAHEMPRSGLGCWYALDVETGRECWRTAVGPWSSAAVDDERVLLGMQGYGAFATLAYDREGQQVRHWRAVGRYVVGAHGVRVVEMSNAGEACHVSWLREDGREKGVRLNGYYTSDVYVSDDGALWFWRHGAVHRVDVRGELVRTCEVGRPTDYVGSSARWKPDELVLILGRNDPEPQREWHHVRLG